MNGSSKSTSDKGFSNIQVSEDNLLVSAQGTVAQAQHAFNLTLRW